MRLYLLATFFLMSAASPVMRAANPSYDPRWLPGDTFKVRFQFSLTRAAADEDPPTVATTVTYNYVVGQLLMEGGRPVAKILAVPDESNWSQWLLTMDTSAITLTSVEEVETAIKYVNPFGTEAWMAKLDQYHRTIIHDFPKIPDTNASQSRTLSGGQTSTPGFTQTITFGPSMVTAAMSRTDPPTSLLHQTTIVWQAGAKWWTSAVTKLGNDVVVSGTLVSVGRSCATISPITGMVPGGGGSSSITVTAPPGCSWTATSNADWIAISSGASGSGNGTVIYSVQANTDTLRTGTLTIAGQLVTIGQQVVAPPLTAVLSSPAPPVVSRSAVATVGALEMTVSGGTAGQPMTVSVQVFLNFAIAAMSDTAQLTDPTGTSIAGIKPTGNSYAFLNVPIVQPGPGVSQVYQIANMKVNTSSVPGPFPVSVLAEVAIIGGPLLLNSPTAVVAFVQ